MTSIGRVFPPAVVLEMHCRNSYPIDGVKRTRVGPTLPAGYILMEGRPRTNPEQDRVLAQRSEVVVNVKGLNLIST